MNVYDVMVEDLKFGFGKDIEYRLKEEFFEIKIEDHDRFMDHD